MSITSVSPTPTNPFATSSITAVSGSAFDASLQSSLSAQASANSTTQSAYKTEQGRGAPGGRHHHHHGDAGSSTQAADPSASQSTPQSAGDFLASDLKRGLQAYGATTSLG
jgi:hypothetical protein